MRRHFCLLLFFLAGSFDPASAVELHRLMPREGDHTSMWWAKGFPSHSSDTPWHRCVQTGHYGFVLDTESMQIPHFGPLASGELSTLPPALLGLRMVVDRKAYDCVAGGRWTRKTGPRLIESGRFFQRGDVTDLVFKSSDGETLNVDARMETSAWPDRLGLSLFARPGKQSIQPGEDSFGRTGGGFGLDGTNEFEIPHDAKLDSETFTLCFWTFVPEDYRASDKTPPWLVCKNRNEAHRGNFGILIVGGKPEARMNIGGGRGDSFTARSQTPIQTGQWHHFAMSYDGSDLCLYLNGKIAARQSVNRPRVAGRHSLTFGRREDNSGDGYHYRGVIDEIAFYDRGLDESEVQKSFRNPQVVVNSLKPTRHWGFREDGLGSIEMPREQWKSCDLAIALRSNQKVLRKHVSIRSDDGNADPSWHRVSLAIDPVSFEVASQSSPVSVSASEVGSGAKRPVFYDDAVGWHRINLDGVEPTVAKRPTDEDSVGDPRNAGDPRNDSMERVRLVLSNASDREHLARLMFEKTRSGIRQRIGTPITGISAVLRDADGNPTGIPVQLSKNWHIDGTDDRYATQWFHGVSQVRLPAHSKVELELSIVYGHWGGVAAASTSQLSLIGWGSNQLWNQAAIGSWGESICFEPDQAQANCSITDVRPLMLKSKPRGEQWQWTANVGGGDFFRMFDRDGNRVPHTGMKTTFHRYGPCLTEVTNSGQLTDAITHAETISLARTDDILRVTYHLRMQVKQATDFSRLAIFQVGADTYNFTRERKMAIGNVSGLIKEWNTTWGGDQYRTKPIECIGNAPWASLHDAIPREKQPKPESWANRGIVIRSWKARLGGNDASAWMAERGVDRQRDSSSTLDIVPPPGVNRLEAGDFVDATVEHLIVPRDADDYYGPSKALHAALAKDANTWRMVAREALGNRHETSLEIGELQHQHPDVCIKTIKEESRGVIAGGVGYIPVTFTGLTSPSGYQLSIDGQRLDQSVHGNDFWQTDYDAGLKQWSRTYNVPVGENGTVNIHFRKTEEPRS